MSEPSTGPRRYSEQEVGRILQRASEMQVAEPSSGPGGMTLQDLEDIALEAGIDPRHLRRAALELESGGDPSIWARLAGQPLELRFETSVPGQLSPAGFERVLSVIQQAARDHGHASQLGQTLTWQGETSNGTRSTQVVVTSRDGETRIRVEEKLHGLASELFGGIVGGVGGGVGVGMGVGLGVGVLGSALFAAVFPVGTLAVAWIAAREAYRLRAGARQRALSALLERLRDEVEATGAGALPSAEGPRAALPRG